MLPHDQDMQEGLRMATEAMQAAADAMTVATTSFRRQTLMHEELASRRTTSLPHRQSEDDQDEYGATRPGSRSRDRVISVHQLAAALAREGFTIPEHQDDRIPELEEFASRIPAEVTPPTSQDGRLPATVQFPPRLSTQPSRLLGATRRMSHQNLRGSSRRTTLSEGSTLINKSSGVGAARMTSEAFHRPERSWPAQPVFEDQGPYAPEHNERYGSRSNLVQGTEQSNRFSASRWPLGQTQPGMGPGGTRDVDGSQGEYFSPVIRMGRYTYIRTDGGESGASL